MSNMEQHIDITCDVLGTYYAVRLDGLFGEGKTALEALSSLLLKGKREKLRLTWEKVDNDRGCKEGIIERAVFREWIFSIDEVPEKFTKALGWKYRLGVNFNRKVYTKAFVGPTKKSCKDYAQEVVYKVFKHDIEEVVYKVFKHDIEGEDK